MKITSAIVLSLGALLSYSTTQAITLFSAELTTDQETTPVTLTTTLGAPRPVPSGTADFILNDDQTELTFTATIFNIDVIGSQTPNELNDDLVAAHIHGPAPIGGAAGVVWGFFGTPDSDINPNDLLVTPLPDGVGGTISSKWDVSEGQATTLTAQLSNLLAGNLYINFHTVQNRAGEIRGQIIPTPDGGSTALLLACSLFGFASLRRR